ncbi:Hypp7966 [Branchiostoma lanceolatum]|uniref:Hypp7966 protein n=1 Tax=Branchiostoma lanceolatum TaxID=7740 RepID=A0A8J9Z5L4_BRALA|nr:Hypp7966 [Branchiostoma lanceolatum]
MSGFIAGGEVLMPAADKKGKRRPTRSDRHEGTSETDAIFVLAAGPGVNQDGFGLGHEVWGGAVDCVSVTRSRTARLEEPPGPARRHQPIRWGIQPPFSRIPARKTRCNAR